MNEYLAEIKTGIVLFFSALAAFLGWKGIMAVVWICLTIMDWLTGTAAARKNGTWKSSVSRDGAWHKFGSALVVVVAFMADFIMKVALPHIPVLNISWPELLAPMVLAWYIVTELGSILENAIKLGAPVPTWIVKIFDATLQMANRVGDAAVEALTEKEAVEEYPAEETKNTEESKPPETVE